MVHFIHSYSCKPSSLETVHAERSKKRLFTTVWCYALSLAYLKREGFKCNLHTDAEGKELLGFLPYDNIYLTCERQREDGIHPRFWAAAKFYALEAEDLDAIHIDGDVFIKDKDTINVLADMDFDILIQSTEQGNDDYDQVIKFLKSCGDPDYMKTNFNISLEKEGAYNTGIVWLRNQELKDKFLNTYFKSSTYYSQYRQYNFENQDIFPDIVLEQMCLKQLSGGYNSKVLLNDDTSKDEANEIGYQHLLAFTKYRLLDKIKETLHKVSPEIYEEVKKRTEPMEKEYQEYVQKFIEDTKEKYNREGKFQETLSN